MKEFYVLESIRKQNFDLNIYFFKINAIIFDDMNSISIANFEIVSTKIATKQLLNRMIHASIDLKFIEISFNYENVLMREHVVKKSNKENNSFVIQQDEFDISIETNINNHWKFDIWIKIREILNKHKLFFRFELERFNDEINMSMLFLNEKNVADLKQATYFMFMRDKVVMNEIMNSLLIESWIQKILFKTILSISFSTFVIWRNEKSRIIMNL